MNCVVEDEEYAKQKMEDNYRIIDGAKRAARVAEALEKMRTSCSDRLGYKAASGTAARFKRDVLGCFDVEGLLDLQRRRSQKDGASGVDLRDDGLRVWRENLPKASTKKVACTGWQNEREGGEAEA